MNTESRQSFLGDELESRQREERPAVVGLCGGGSHIGQQLAHIGFQQIMTFDFDWVEDSNRTRMIGSQPMDAVNSALKTDVVGRLIKSINPDCDNEKFSCSWQEAAEHLRTATVIFGCVDKLSVRDELERFARRNLIPYIDIGMDVHKTERGFSISGQVAISLPGEPCLHCMGVVTKGALELEHQRYGDAGGRPQVIWPNGVLASVAIGQYMDMILPWSDEPNDSLLKEYDGNRHELRESTKSRILRQNACTHYPRGKDLGNPFFKLSQWLQKLSDLKDAA